MTTRVLAFQIFAPPGCDTCLTSQHPHCWHFFDPDALRDDLYSDSLTVQPL